MKKNFLTFAAAAALATGAVHGTVVAQVADSTFIASQTQDQYMAKDQLIGAKVHGPDGKIIGDVEDLIINDSNQVVGVVMGTGGFLGLAEKKVGVSLGALTFEDNDSGKTIVSLPGATPEALTAAPAFERVQPKKSLLERAQEKVQELSDKTKATTQDAVDAAKPKLEAAKEKAAEAYEKAKEAAQPAIEKAKEAAHDAKEAVEDAVDAATKSTDDAAPEPGKPAEPPAAEPAP